VAELADAHDSKLLRPTISLNAAIFQYGLKIQAFNRLGGAIPPQIKISSGPADLRPVYHSSITGGFYD